MSRWIVRVQECEGRADLVLVDRGTRPGTPERVVGHASLTLADYSALCRSVLRDVVDRSRRIVAQHLGERIWVEAQTRFDNSPELAKQKIIEFGLSQAMIDGWAEQISKLLGLQFAELLPEHTP